VEVEIRHGWSRSTAGVLGQTSTPSQRHPEICKLDKKDYLCEFANLKLDFLNTQCKAILLVTNNILSITIYTVYCQNIKIIYFPLIAWTKCQSQNRANHKTECQTLT
jgi:hypothetical protein